MISKSNNHLQLNLKHRYIKFKRLQTQDSLKKVLANQLFKDSNEKFNQTLSIKVSLSIMQLMNIVN